MKIHRLSAVFGRLQGETLELGDGLTILQAPNESGKSTWCALLTAMLYGVNSRERDRGGVLAEKNRYAPWDGGVMSGRMDCACRLGELSITRETRRQNAPMGAFSACRAGTGDPVPGLDGSNCGETLLGISREVFERSAMIRQSGLGISASPELEKRILSLITTGEEGLSFTEAEAALRQQLNRRRHNRTGRIPEREAQREEIRARRQLLESQEIQLTQAKEQLRQLEEFQRRAEGALQAAERYAAVQQRKGLAALRTQAEERERELAALRSRAETERLPENEAISRLRGAIVNLETVRRQLGKARDSRDEAMKDVLRAESAVQQSPFAGQTPEQARNAPLPLGKRPGFPLWVILPALLVGGLPLLWQESLGLLPTAGIGLLAAVCVLLAAEITTTRKRRRWESTAAEKRQAQEEAAAAYTALYEASAQAQAEAERRGAAADALYETLRGNEQAILLEVRRFAPEAFDAATADQALRRCAQQRRALSEAENAAREARLRYELSRKEAGEEPLTEEELALPAPEHTEEELRAALASARRRAEEVRDQVQQLTGALASGGSAEELAARERRITLVITKLQEEYDAIALAIEALGEANTALQSRFSPALGRRAAEIFAQLTDGRYDAVALDRSFRLSAEPQGSFTYRDSQFLSAGAIDQLYLAVRLAICELVLPEGESVPLILDDALATFDDARCAAALRFLRQESEKRQILLFTCHSREAALLRGDPAVRIGKLP